MSKFFKALERAKQQRLLQEGTSYGVSYLPETAVHTPVASAQERSATVELPESNPPSGPPLVRPDTQKRSRPEAVLVKKEGPFPRAEGHLVSLLDPASFEAEQYRTLRYVVEQTCKQKNLRVIAVTSAAVGDGKTLTAINLAGALALSSDVRVLIVDADLRHPSVGNYLGIAESGRPSLVDAILNSGRSLEEVVRRHPPFNLSVLPVGQPAAAPHEVLRSPRLGALLEQARARYDYVVLDMPPLIAVPDCRVMAKWVDGFVLVVTAHKTPRKLVEEALNVLEPEKTIGIVFNKDDRLLAAYNRGYYTHGPTGERSSRLWRRLRPPSFASTSGPWS